MLLGGLLALLTAFAAVPAGAAGAPVDPGSAGNGQGGGPPARVAVIVRVASTADLPDAVVSANAAGATVGYVYDHAFPGFSATMPAPA
ncbi:MAG: hypothetical protein ABW211_04605, partial [Acidimicrobiia bacterium]